MDAMLWKAAAVVSPMVATVGITAGNQALESCEQVRSVQIAAVRSSVTHSKSCPSLTGSHAPPTDSIVETPSGVSPSLTPLPLPPPRSLIPSTLKFLWFNNKVRETGGENNEMAIPVGVIDPSSDDNDASACTKDRRMEVNDCGLDAISNIATDPMCVDVSDEQTCAASGQSSELDKLTISDGDMVQSVQQKSEPSDDIKARNWLRRILALKSFWQDSKAEALPSNTDSDDDHRRATVDSNSIAGSTRNVERCSGCEFDSLHGCTLELPHTKVVHNRDSFSKFLQHAALFDMKVISQMSFLCNLAYAIPDIKPGELLKYHKLRFATSSLDMKANLAAKSKNIKAEKFCNNSKSSGLAREDDRNSKITHGERTDISSMFKHSVTFDNRNSREEVNFVSMIPTVASKLAAALGSYRRQPNQDGLVPSEGSLSTYQKQSIIGTQLRSDVACEAPAYMVNENSVKLCDGSPLDQSLGNQGSLDVASLMAASPVTAVVAAEEETKQAVADDLQSLQSCPCEWFVCDDSASHIRLFVIQGSESLASWQANLFFEPTKFEGLGILVHRGIYEAAKGLYEQILPEVLNHLETHGTLAQVRFTGHSLGGSLSTLVALMLFTRGVIPRHALLPVITFGAPCIMCGGDLLLQKLGLPPNQIQSVIMHRDIVPRAFACDYPDHVAQVLKRLNGSFRDHPCLNQQSLLYAPMGQILVLQPDKKQAPEHPLLPSGSGLYILQNFMTGCDIHSVTQLRAAQRAFLNTPHPLEILSDPGAYGFDGAVSRNHDSQRYSDTINAILHQELRRLRRMQREQRRQLWWPLVTAETSLLVQRGLKSGLAIEDSGSGGELSSAITKSSLGFRHIIIRRFEFLVGRSYVSRPFKERFSRYARLIASKHVQIGMLLIFSVPLIMESIALLVVRI